MKRLIYTLIIGLFPLILTAQWYPLTSGTNLNLTSVSFSDSLNGWVVGEEGLILYTNDGGITWEEQESGTSTAMHSVCFADTLNGWIVGSDSFWMNECNTTMLNTTDGGNTWNEVYSDTVFGFGKIYFTDLLHGWSLGWYYGYYTYMEAKQIRTTDGGTTWNNVSLTWWPMYDVCFVDSDHGWVVGGHYSLSGFYYDYIFHSNNGGQNWEEQLSIQGRYAPRFSSVHFSDTLNGWAVGSGGIILNTSDGGVNWDTAYILDPYGLHSVYFSDSLNGWVVGSGGVILNTSDGGVNWEFQESGVTENLNEIIFTDSLHGWIVGSGGTILHTDNGGIVGIENEYEWDNTRLRFKIFPNPFSASTTLTFELSQSERVDIQIFNQLGELVNVVQWEGQQGKNQFTWDTRSMPGGIYFIQLQAKNQVVVKEAIKL